MCNIGYSAIKHPVLNFRSRFGLVSAGAVSGAFGFVIGQVYYRRRNRVIKKRHERDVETMVKRHKDEKDRLAKAFREEMQVSGVMYVFLCM